MNSGLMKFLTNGGLTKFLAIVFLFLLSTAALVVAGVEILQGMPLNPYVVSVLTVAAGSAATIVGVHVGLDVVSHNGGPPSSSAPNGQQTP